MVGQIKKGEESVQSLENEMTKMDGLRKENKRVTNYSNDLRSKSVKLESELKEFKSKNQNLEELVVQLNKNLKKIDLIKKNRTLVDKENIEKNESVRKDKRYNTSKSKISLKSESSWDGMCGVYKDFEMDRRKYLELIEGLERRLMEVSVQKASGEAELKERIAQWSSIQKEVQQKSMSVMMLEKQVREKSLREEVLLREVEEGGRTLKEVSGQLQMLRKECEGREEERQKEKIKVESLEERLNECIKGMQEKKEGLQEGEKERMRLVEEAEEMRHKLVHSEDRSEGLQRSLDEIARASNVLKFEIQQSNEHSQIIMNSLEHEIKLQNETIHLLEKDKSSLDQKRTDLNCLLSTKMDDITKLKNHIKSFEFNLKVNGNFINDKNEEIDKLNRLIREKESMIDKLKRHNKISEKEEEEWKDKMNLVVEEKNAENKEIKKNAATMSVSLEELRCILKEKDTTVGDLSRKNKANIEEKKQIIEEMGKEIKTILKDFKDEKKYNWNILNELECIKNENVQLTYKLTDKNEEINLFKIKLENSEKNSFVKLNENKNITNEIERLNTQIKILNLNLNGELKKNNDVKNEINSLKKDLLGHKTKVEQYKYESEQNEIKINKLNDILTEKTIDLEKKNLLITKMSFDSKEMSNNSEEKISRELEIMNLKNELKNKKEKGKKYEEEAFYLKENVRKVSEELVRIQNVNLNLDKERSSCLQEMEHLQKSNNNFKLEVNTLKRNKTGREQQLESELESLKEQFKQKELHLMNVKTSYNQLQQKLSHMNSLLKDKDCQISDLNELKRMKEEELKRAENEYNLNNEKLKVDLLDMKIEKNKFNLHLDDSTFCSTKDLFRDTTHPNDKSLNKDKKNEESDFSLISYNSAIIKDIFDLNTNADFNFKNSDTLKQK